MRVTFHPLVSGVMIAAIIAAVMSSADSCLSSLATVVMEDIYLRHLHPGATDRQLLRVAQGATFTLGAAGTVCAWVSGNVAALLEIVYDFWAPTMVLPFLVALFWYHESRIYAVVASMVAGSASTVVWRFGLGSPADVRPALFGFAVAVLVFFLTLPFTSGRPLSHLFRPAAHDQRSPDP